MKKKKIILIAAILGIAFTSSLFAGSESKLDLPGLNKSVNEGFVFIDGRYVQTPYKVTVQKGWLCINDIPAEKLSEWPLTEESSEKPKITEKVLKNTESTTNIEFWKYSAKMYRWIKRNIQGEKAQLKAIQLFYESMTFIKKVSISKNGGVDILLANGKIEHKACAESVPPIVTKKQKLEILERSRKSIEERLEKGDSYFFFPKLGERINFSLGRIGSCENLKLMTEVLTSGRTEKDKLNILFRMMLINEDEPETGLMLTRNFKPSEELNRRIAELIKATGVKPHTLKDLPKELPSVIATKQRRLDNLK